MSRFLLPRYDTLAPYTPGEQPKGVETFIKLNTNEAPFPPAAPVRAAAGDAELQKLRLYPDPTGSALKEKLAALYGVEKDEVYLANGSDDILYFAFLAYCTSAPAVFCDVTYGFYKVFASLVGAESTVVPLKEDFSVDVDALCAARGTVFLANPNAPTARALPLFEIERILQSDRNRIVLVDEAYVDFGAESALSLLNEYDNLLVVRTFSKSRAMAGARLGYAFANKSVIADLERIRYSTNPYNINRLTLLLGEKTVECEAYYRAEVEKVCQTRDAAAENLKKLGFFVTESRTNFLFCRHASASAEALYESLKARGILVRYFGGEARLKEYLRISVGTNEEMQTLVETLNEILKETL